MEVPPFTVAACATTDIQGDVSAALAEMHIRSEQARASDVDLLVFPEGFLQGFTRDGDAARARAFDLSSSQFKRQVLDTLRRWDPMLIFGLIEIADECLYNTAVVVHRGKLVGSYRKRNIHPTEAVYSAGSESPVFEHRGRRFGVNICYDARFPDSAAELQEQGIDLLVYPLNNMHPADTAERWRHRHLEFLRERAQQTGAWVISADVTGHREDHVGYGPTAVVSPDGSVAARVPELERGMVLHCLP